MQRTAMSTEECTISATWPPLHMRTPAARWPLPLPSFFSLPRLYWNWNLLLFHMATHIVQLGLPNS